MSAVPVQNEATRHSARDGPLEWDISQLTDDQKVPPPKYRHAAPSAPWPWMDFSKDVPDVPTKLLDADPLKPQWNRYPQSHFANWTPDQVNRCRMLTICQKERDCQIHKVDIFASGTFHKPPETRPRRIPASDLALANKFWNELKAPFDTNLRVRAIFIEDITLNMLTILGARYNVEPFFFASSANWIPSRYQEDPHHGVGDHITVVLPFIRVIKRKQEASCLSPSSESRDRPKQVSAYITDKDQTIDTQAPLVLSDKNVLVQDLLAIHMVRNVKENIIISYHHQSKLQKTTAGRLRSLVQRTGDSVYWSKIYAASKDPTFVFLAMLWYAMYAWDEAFEVLYEHLTEELEATNDMIHHKEDIDATKHLKHTRELHKVQAHLLYYQQLLRDFTKSVEFVRDTPNPALEWDSITDEERESSMKLMKQETENLLSEIERMEKLREIQSDRLENAIKLAFSTINIEDSKSMKKLTMATLRDSAATKQISYLTLVFLPASFLSSVFGMNVVEINGTKGSPPLVVYVGATIVLTAITVWIAIALQKPSSFHRDDMVERIAWPIFFGSRSVKQLMRKITGKLFVNKDKERSNAIV